MSVQCECKTWMKSYGFAEAETGEVVYVHASDIPGMRMQAGGVIFCDLVPVEGHGGRVKGTNVSGPGLVPKTQYRSDADIAEERQEWRKFKEDKIASHGSPPPQRPARVAGKGSRTPAGGKGTISARAPPPRGMAAGIGSGPLPIISARQSTAVSREGLETRIDPADGAAYTKEEFKACYGGYTEWDAAAPKRLPPAAGARSGSPEKRIDPADGNAYTKDNFYACYGGYREWDKAVPYSSNTGRGRGARR